MKNIIFYGFLLITIGINAQEKVHIAHYKINENIGFTIDSPEFSKTKNDAINTDLKKLNYKNYLLLFNATSSLYKEDELLERHNSKVQTISSSLPSKLYKDSKQILKQLEFLGKRFLIKDSLQILDWTIHANKTKTILDYQCIKASTKITRVNEGKQYTDEVTCYFTKSIKTNQGPDVLHGLEGLILEAKINDREITCYDIKLNTNKKLTKPNKGKLVTKAEFDAIVANRLKQKQF